MSCDSDKVGLRESDARHSEALRVRLGGWVFLISEVPLYSALYTQIWVHCM